MIKENMIKDYHFGAITINGQTYNHDVEVCSDGQVLAWQRKESHFIDIGDIARAFDEKPEMIVIGTGASGVAQVSEKVEQEVQKKDIELIIKPTPEAIEVFNQLKDKKIIGFFHLTC